MTSDYNPKSAPPPPPGQSVGYKRPPVGHQFKMGKSGNPRGRPKSKNQGKEKAPSPRAPALESIMLVEAYRTIEIRENGKLEQMPMIQAVLRSLGVTAAKGNLKAQMAIVGLTQAIEQRHSDEARQFFEAIVEYKASWEQEFAECDHKGVPRPDVLPHPDDLAINARTGEVIYNGPFDDAEKAIWDRLLERKAEAIEEIAKHKKDARRKGVDKEKILAYIQTQQNTIDRVDAFIPDISVRRRPDFNISEWRDQKRKILEIKKELRKKS